MSNIKFQELNLSDYLLKAINDKGYEQTTSIQGESIPLIMQGNDIIGQSQTGTGKTMAFSIPIIEKINSNINKPQAIILTPTRELAVQLSNEISDLLKYKKSINVLSIYGGTSIERQIKALKKGVEIIVGTPGRIMDHLNRKTIKTDEIQYVVLDEADEMLNMGFEEDIVTILKNIKEERQTILFSATMPKKILDITKKYLKNPVHVKPKQKEATSLNIEQRYIETKEKNKLEILTRLIDINETKSGVVFCNTKRKVDDLIIKLNNRGYLAEGIHGDMKQIQRERVMNKFRKKNIDFLVATDVAARGIDVADIEIVFNYDIPVDLEYYIHRIGRTGRIGKKGIAYTFVTGNEIYQLRQIEKYIKMEIHKAISPTLEDVNEKKHNDVISKVSDIILNNTYAKSSEKLFNRLLGDEYDYSGVEIAKALYSIYVDNSNMDNNSDDKIVKNNNNMVTIFFNVGRRDNMKVKDFVGALAANVKMGKEEVGKIDIHDNYTFVEIPADYEKDVIKNMKKCRIKGILTNVESKYKK